MPNVECQELNGLVVLRDGFVVMAQQKITHRALNHSVSSGQISENTLDSTAKLVTLLLFTCLGWIGSRSCSVILDKKSDRVFHSETAHQVRARIGRQPFVRRITGRM